VGSLVLAVQQNVPTVDISGKILVEDPYVAGKFSAVPNAQVQIAGMAAVSADATGFYHYDAVPQSFAKAAVTAYDPVSSARIGFSVPSSVHHHGEPHLRRGDPECAPDGHEHDPRAPA